MAIQLALGDESFEEIRSDGLYHVDKTELLYDLLRRSRSKVALFTRPRRFGKTLNMSMMQCFFDITRDSRGLFEGLAVTQHEEFCREWMNQYSVLFISFKDILVILLIDEYDVPLAKASEKNTPENRYYERQSHGKAESQAAGDAADRD